MIGRTPNINKDGGRDHWGRAQSALLAGGIRGGQVFGSTDKKAAEPKDNPVSPEAEIHDRQNRPYRIIEGEPVTALFG